MTKISRIVFLLSVLSIVSFSLTAFAVNFYRAGDLIDGNPRGKITVVEFFDYQCPHCVTMAPKLEEMLQSNPNVRLIYKQLPVRGPESELAARAVFAANLQGKYKGLSRALFMTQESYSPQLIMQLAKAEGLNTTKLQRDMYGKTVNNQLNHAKALAQMLRVQGTPAFFVGRSNASPNTYYFLYGEVSQTELQNAINKVNQ